MPRYSCNILNLLVFDKKNAEVGMTIDVVASNTCVADLHPTVRAVGGCLGRWLNVSIRGLP